MLFFFMTPSYFIDCYLFVCFTDLKSTPASFTMDNKDSVRKKPSNVVSKKNEIFVHNTRRIDENMLVALDILCKYKLRNSLSNYQYGLDPVAISFLTKDNLVYHIIVANEENKRGIVKKINSYPLSIPKADKFILAFPDREEIKNCTLNYCKY